MAQMDLREPVGLMGAGMVERVDAVRRVDEADPVVADPHEAERAHGDIVEMADRCVHARKYGKTSTMVEVKRLTVGELAERAGVATSALRFYEEHGLLVSERFPERPSSLPAAMRCRRSSVPLW